MLHERRTNYSMIPIPLYRNLWLRSLATLVKKITVITFLVREEKGVTEDEMAGWHHWLSAHEFGWTPGVGDGQGGLVSAIHGVAKSQTRLSNWTELDWTDVRFNGLSQCLSGKEPPCSAGAAGDTCSIPGSGRSPGGGHGSVLARRILWMEQPGGLESMGSQRVRRSWSDLAQHTQLICIKVEGAYVKRIVPQYSWYPNMGL